MVILYRVEMKNVRNKDLDKLGYSSKRIEGLVKNNHKNINRK